MSRKFLRPLFSFWDPMINEPFLPKKAIPGGSKANKMYNRNPDKKPDPEETFDNFYKEYYETSNNLRNEEKQFFEKHYPEKVGKKFNPYQTLGVDKNADLERIKQAYRDNAIKYHPKVNQAPESRRKFDDLARAYNELLHEKQTSDYGEDVSTKSLFENFHQDMQSWNKNEEHVSHAKTDANKDNKDAKKDTKASQKDEGKANVKTSQKKDDKSESKSGDKNQVSQKSQDKSKNSMLKGAELYSESSYFEFIDGKRKLHVTKMYEKDGKTIKVDRVEQNLPDGTVEVNQTYDDGTQVKNNKYIQGSSRKQKQINH